MKKDGQDLIELVSAEHTKLQAMANEHKSKRRKIEVDTKPIADEAKPEPKEKEDKKPKKPPTDNDIMVKHIQIVLMSHR
jgi:hypothetical protein